MPQRRIEQARSPKLIICKVALEPRVFFDSRGEFAGGYTTYVLQREIDLRFLCAVLNSRLLNFVFRTLYDALAMGGGYLRFQPPQVRRMPIKLPHERPDVLVGIATRLSTMTDQMQSFQESLAAARTTHEKDALQRQIDATDRQIDRLVYELYGLTDDEIRIVEEATAH